jgi:hypothetical protein
MFWRAMEMVLFQKIFGRLTEEDRNEHLFSRQTRIFRNGGDDWDFVSHFTVDSKRSRKTLDAFAIPPK